MPKSVYILNAKRLCEKLFAEYKKKYIALDICMLPCGLSYNSCLQSTEPNENNHPEGNNITDIKSIHSFTILTNEVKKIKIHMNDVSYVPNINCNLLSVRN